MKIKDFPLGPTGKFPFGPVDASDDGELRLALAVDRAHGIIRMAFGTPVTWLGLPSREARALAAILIEKADELDKGKM